MFLTHRFRYEQRFVENQDFRTRYRYNLFINVPLNKKVLEEKKHYMLHFTTSYLLMDNKILETIEQ